MAGDGYGWWIARFRHLLEQVDLVRIDHFRGFEASWEVPAARPTAVDGPLGRRVRARRSSSAIADALGGASCRSSPRTWA